MDRTTSGKFNLVNDKGKSVEKFSKKRGYQCSKKWLKKKHSCKNSNDLSEENYLAVYPDSSFDSYMTTIDDDGFDMTRLNSDGNYKEKCIIPAGTILIRYGPPTGNYTAPVKTKYENLSLPYKQDENEFHTYIVQKPVVAIKGIVAPWFDQPGGGIQYYTEDNVATLLSSGKLREIICLK